ncbi:helix-turn-helix transcriptional regulator [Nonomuraea sp. NPDC023979]|uniref:helix-turn-helix transcriptional regulator n=1 Tax=Nonomuraea sp. NPDC023979 TaxID=3154796 RepID=UPI0033EAAE9B
MTADMPLMASLAEHRLHLGVHMYEVAEALGITVPTLSAWEHGRRSPRWPHVIAYGRRVDRRIVVRDGDTVLAEGLYLPAQLPILRGELGLSQSDVARRLGGSRGQVGNHERRAGHQLVTVERYVTVGLRLQLTHLAAA